MIRTPLALAGVLLGLSGCAGAPAWLVVAAPAIGWVASVNNLGAQYLKFTHDDELVCPVALTPRQACPVDKVRPVP